MLSVKTYLAPSLIHGIGLFAAEDIPAYSVVWQFNKHIDKILTEVNFLKICRGLNNHALRHFLNSTYRRGGRYFYLTDNARFVNHSEDFRNIYFADDYTEVASRDIKAHEELLEDYRLSYDSEDFFFQELNNPDPDYYVLTIEAPRSNLRGISVAKDDYSLNQLAAPAASREALADRVQVKGTCSVNCKNLS